MPWKTRRALTGLFVADFGRFISIRLVYYKILLEVIFTSVLVHDNIRVDSGRCPDIAGDRIFRREEQMGPVHIQRLGGGADPQTRERTDTVDTRDLAELWAQSADVPTQPAPHQGHDSQVHTEKEIGVDAGFSPPFPYQWTVKTKAELDAMTDDERRAWLARIPGNSSPATDEPKDEYGRRYYGGC